MLFVKSLSDNSPNFGIAHQAFAQTDSRPMSCKCSVTMILRDSIHIGGFPGLDSIALGTFLWCDAPTIVNALKRINEVKFSN